jgi:hypothetical protein
MQILRHREIAVTMDLYNRAAGDSSLRALMALGERLEGPEHHWIRNQPYPGTGDALL